MILIGMKLPEPKLLFSLLSFLVLFATSRGDECIVVVGDDGEEEGSCLNEDLMVKPPDGIFKNDWAGVDQTVDGPQWKGTLKQIYKTKQYMAQVKKDQSVPTEVLKECQDRDGSCQFWASIGELKFVLLSMPTYKIIVPFAYILTHIDIW